jgi:hypothetical protein
LPGAQRAQCSGSAAGIGAAAAAAINDMCACVQCATSLTLITRRTAGTERLAVQRQHSWHRRLPPQPPSVNDMCACEQCSTACTMANSRVVVSCGSAKGVRQASMLLWLVDSVGPRTYRHSCILKTDHAWLVLWQEFELTGDVKVHMANKLRSLVGNAGTSVCDFLAGVADRAKVKKLLPGVLGE